MNHIRVSLLLLLFLSACSQKTGYDVVIRNGLIVDGSGALPFIGDIAINTDTIAATGNLRKAKGKQELDATGLVVAPGFINMLSWATETLIEDGRSQSDIRQGVTLEVMGEGESMGPLNVRMKNELKAAQGDINYEVSWTTLGEYLEFLEKKGVSANICSFVGSSTLRNYFIGYENRKPTEPELDSMRILTRQAMEEGAIGVSSALQYIPAAFAGNSELVAMCTEAKEYGGMYICHLRDEGDRLLWAIDDFLNVVNEAGIRSEIYHFKQAGTSNWYKYGEAVKQIDSANTAGLAVTANMYNYIASSTGFDIIMPDWVQEGGYDEWAKRLADKTVRKAVGPFVKKSILSKTGSADKIMIIGFNNDSLKYLTGMTLAEIAEKRKRPPEETVMDLVIEDGSRVSVVYFSMSEENVKKQITLPWMSFCSDGGSLAAEGVFLKSSTHPRAYGNFARLLGRYVRDEKVISLQEAVRKLTSLPATNMKISRRGSLKEGYYADLAIFNPDSIRDNATFEKPHQYATGMVHVFVNGVQVLKNGEHTGALPGRIVRGPGWNPRTGE